MSGSIEQFISHVEFTNGCWLWAGATLPNGYGVFRNEDGQTIYAHRWAYEFFVGAIPDGLELDHVKSRGCRFRNCVWFEHLEPVTKQINFLRGDHPSAIFCRTGLCHNGHELSGTNVITHADGSRLCRSCKQVRERLYSKRVRAQKKLVAIG